LEFNIPFQHKYGYIRDEARRRTVQGHSQSRKPHFIKYLGQGTRYRDTVTME